MYAPAHQRNTNLWYPGTPGSLDTQSLAQSQREENPALKEWFHHVTALLSASFQKEEAFLDVPFTSEEIAHAIHKMKLKKSSGPDNLSAEHLRHGGHSVVIWLTEILNSIVDAEHVPPSLKLGITIPIYKGGGKDPLDTNSYRGITLI